VIPTQEVDSPNLPNSQSGLPITVLLVDDNPINLKILVMYMTKLKFGYVTATNGLEAVEAYQASAVHIDYILMDISMPVMDGLTATRHIRTLESASKRKPSVIAAITGLGSTQAQQRAYSSGIDVYLAKPVAMKTIGELISGRAEVDHSNRLKALKIT
jgi:CheY-like chemotaxis protein